MTHKLRRILVDLTPLLPGGGNGGAKPLTRALIAELSALAPQVEFTLLTSAVGYDDVADLERPNVRRENVDVDLAVPHASGIAVAGARVAARGVVNALLPPHARMQMKDAVWTLFKRWQRTSVTRTARADLVFCPFTAPFFFDPRVPLVSVVHDLQYLEYPEFFEALQQTHRHEYFLDACRLADRLICVSDFVRQTVLVNSHLPPERVQTIHSGMVHTFAPDQHASETAGTTLERLGICWRRFLLYPANPWPHKNHKLLIEAFARFRRAAPDSDLALVCTGAPGVAADELTSLAAQCCPPASFAFAGYLPEPEFVAMLQSCRGLIFPSLYEGFGLPVLEAMACGKPVLCSNVTSLPEVAGDAAVLFDPHDVDAIAHAIGRLELEPDLDTQLVQRGHARAQHFGDARRMAGHYLAAFEEVVARRPV
ncbi:MAG: glycosyltransferase family 4 protein [Chloroflexota bacterium]